MASQYENQRKQSKQEPNKLPRKKAGRATLVDSGLPALVVALCSKISKYSDTNRMLSSSTKQAHDDAVVRTDYNLAPFQLPQLIW